MSTELDSRVPILPSPLQSHVSHYVHICPTGLCFLILVGTPSVPVPCHRSVTHIRRVSTSAGASFLSRHHHRTLSADYHHPLRGLS